MAAGVVFPPVGQPKRGLDLRVRLLVIARVFALPSFLCVVIFKMAEVAGMQRDIFHLPFISAPFADHCMHNSRSARKKRSQKVHDVGRTYEAIAALNDLYDCVVPEASAVPIASQLAAQEHIFRSVTRCGRLRPFSKSRPRKPVQRFSDHPPCMATEVSRHLTPEVPCLCQMMLRFRLL